MSQLFEHGDGAVQMRLEDTARSSDTAVHLRMQLRNAVTDCLPVTCAAAAAVAVVHGPAGQAAQGGGQADPIVSGAYISSTVVSLVPRRPIDISQIPCNASKCMPVQAACRSDSA